ncbi:L,D-transpeptidase [Candidatus Roizmanbacteria bacterium]|nr:L,D-transpeptidase [Candidatus Roizmanbacteria bacterium]
MAKYTIYFILTSVTIYALAAFIYPSITSNFIRCANSISCKESLKLKIENNTVGTFNNHSVSPPNINLAEEKKNPTVLGLETGTGEKHIYVNLATQTLSAYQGDKLVFQTLISSGKWFPTPIGEYTIWSKLRATRMTGGEGADYYDLPNVPYVMFFSNDKVPGSAGFSLHGAYWHNNFGHPMSHGCVNMRIIDAEKVYDWANPPTKGNITYANAENLGTKITIYGEAPL